MFSYIIAVDFLLSRIRERRALQVQSWLLRASERSERASYPEYERPAGRSSKANILGTEHPIDKRSSLLNVTWT